MGTVLNMYRLLILGLWIGLAPLAWSAEQEQREPPEQEEKRASTPLEDIETILTQPMGQEEYVEAQRCLSRYQYQSVKIIDDQHVLFEGRRGKAWLNTLRRRCIGLRRHDIPVFDNRTARAQLCNLDDFVGMEQRMSGLGRASATCVLGDFQPVTEQQVALIKATVESRKGRRSKRKKDPGEQPSDVDGGAGDEAADGTDQAG